MTLLIVEDEDIIRKGLIVTLRKLEMDFEHIYEAGDGEEGLRLCREYTPDIIMTDIKMPLMDGLAFIRESQKLLPEGQFIILSGYSDFEYARTALKYGVKDYLLKPSTKNEIKEVLTRVVEQLKEQHGKSKTLTESDVKMIKELTVALKNIADVMRDVYGLPTIREKVLLEKHKEWRKSIKEAEKVTGGVIFLPEVLEVVEDADSMDTTAETD